MKRKLLPRVLISLLGVALIVWAAGSLVLGLFGEPATAVVTHIRREGGDRAGAVQLGILTTSVTLSACPTGRK